MHSSDPDDSDRCATFFLFMGWEYYSNLKLMYSITNFTISSLKKERNERLQVVCNLMFYNWDWHLFERVASKTISLDSPHSFTIICFTLSISEELMQKTFSTFGNIQEIRVFKDKGYAFVR